MIALIQAFFGIALAHAGISIMANHGSVDPVSLIACFAGVVLVLKGLTRFILWTARSRSGSPK